MQYKIKKGIPIPPRNTGRKSMYPFAEMRIGDSFAVMANKARSVSAASQHFGKLHKQKFICRRIDGGYRCWRVK